MKSDFVSFIETQWRSYEGNNQIEFSTLKSPDESSDAFEFIAYCLKETVDKISHEEHSEFLNKHETGVLRHPNVSSLDHAYFALAKVNFRPGRMDSSQEELWKENCLRI